MQRCRNDRLSVNEIIAKVCSGASTLKLGLSSINIYGSLNSIKIGIAPNRADMILRNLIRINVSTTITNKSSQSNLFLETALHNIALVSNNIEISNVVDIITMQSVAEIYGLRISGTHKNLHVSRDGLLALTILIALRTNILSASVNLSGTNTGNRTLASLGQNLLNPIVIALKQFGSTRIHILVIGEQSIDSINTVRKSILVISSIHFDGALQSHTRSLRHLNNFLLVSVTQHIHLLNRITIKNVGVHSIISSFRVFHRFLFVVFGFVFFIRHVSVFKSLADQSINNRLLLLGEGVKHILHGLFLSGLLFLFYFSFCHFSFFLLFNTFAVFIGLFTIFGMGKLSIFISSLFFTMS